MDITGAPLGLAATEAEVMEWFSSASEARQREKGDCLPQGLSIRQPDLRGIEVDESESESLAKIWKEYGRKRQKDFIQKFGHIAYLASIKVDVNMIKAMIKFWDPVQRCFTFGKFDLTPTLEEYTTMIYGEDVSLPDKVFRHNDGSSIPKAFEMATGIASKESAEYFKDLGSGNNMCIPMAKLKDLILKPGSGTSTLALAIYGAIIFPKTTGYVHRRVTHFFSRMLTPSNPINPISAILAETIRTLNHCSTTGTGKFEGCSQLLFIWIMSHLPPLKEFGYNNKPPPYCPIIQRQEINPIRRFIPECEPTKETTMLGWQQYFTELNEVKWKAAWMRLRPFIHRCGGLWWVPLIGIWGVVSYAPAMVLRQFGYNQYVPATDGLSECEFECKWLDNKQELRNMVIAWDSVKRIEGPDGKGEGASVGYEEWQKNRGKGFTAPPVLGFVSEPPPAFINSHDYRMEEKAKYQVVYDAMEAEKEEMVRKITDLTTQLAEMKANHEEEKERDRATYRWQIEKFKSEEGVRAKESIDKVKMEKERLQKKLRVETLKFENENNNRKKLQEDFKDYRLEAKRKESSLQGKIKQHEEQIAYLQAENQKNEDLYRYYHRMAADFNAELAICEANYEKSKTEGGLEVKKRKMWEKSAIERAKQIDDGQVSLRICMDQASKMADQIDDMMRIGCDEAKVLENISILEDIRKELRMSASALASMMIEEGPARLPCSSLSNI